MNNNPEDSRLYQKALNNYLYVRALQEQQNQQENQENSENQENQQNSGQENQQNQQQQNQEQNEQQSAEQNQEQQEEIPSQSISPTDIDNLLSVAEKDEKDNLSRQFKKTEELFQQNKY
ncbi:MAG: hypothetical protein ACRC0X_08605, partial [Brevinema sp.]